MLVSEIFAQENSTVFPITENDSPTVLIRENVNVPEKVANYRLNEVYFLTNGVTKPSALKRKVKLDKSRIFKTESEIKEYLDNINQQLINTRLLETCNYTYTFVEKDQENYKCNVTFITSDSNHLLALPKPTLDSNKGLQIKVKLKDMNFLGFMSDLNFDFNYENEFDSSTGATLFSGEHKHSFGMNFQYDFPFTFLLDNTWTNDLAFSWTIGSNLPEFSYATGLTTSIPIGIHSLNIGFVQSVIRNEDYIKYGDELYGVEAASLSIPLVIGTLPDLSEVIYNPAVTFTYNWDYNGISIDNEDLRSPTLSFCHSITTGRVDWTGNYRNGYSVNATQSFGWNFQTKKFIPTLSADFQIHKSINFRKKPFLGFSGRFYYFHQLNSNQEIGARIRGVLDKQYFANGSYYALKVPQAFVLNFDMPFHVITTHWMDWGYKLFGSYDDMSKAAKIIWWLPHKLFNYLDFEFQLSPFFDMALTRKPEESLYEIENSLMWQNGFYSAGIEAIIFPSKWKSFTVRTSIGFDIGKYLFKDVINQEWRDPNIKGWEMFFGLGLHY